MRKSELKTGMVVENAIGQIGKVMLNTSRGDIIAGNPKESEPVGQTWFPMNVLPENLHAKADLHGHQIVKVWDIDSNRSAASMLIKGRLIWEKPKLELTLEDVKERLGYDFNLVKDEK